MLTPREERPSSGLSESWATLSTSDVHSEDDAHSVHTDSASLVGTSVAGDVASLDEHDDDDERSDAGSTDIDSHCSESRSFIPPVDSEYDETDGGNLTATASFLSTSASGKPIVFSEPERWWESEDEIELKQALCSLDRNELQGPVRTQAMNFGGELFATVTQSVSQEGLDIDRPFRVLYVGDSHFKGMILDKLGDVLIANPKIIAASSSSEGSNRFHVVPTAFGPSSVHNYAELLPLQVQLMVDECTAEYGDSQDPEKISLILKNGGSYSSYRTVRGFEISSASEWTPPDLAILVDSESDTSALRQRRCTAYHFMERHGIPCMFISEDPLWTTGYPLIPVDRRGPHVAIEADQHATPLGRCPVDLDTFEQLDSEQLNRSLSLLVNSRKRASVSRLVYSDKELIVGKHSQNFALQNLHLYRGEYSRLLRPVMMGLICIFTLSLGYSGVKFLVALLLQYFSSSTAVSLLQETSLSPSTTAWSTRETGKSLATLPTLTSSRDMALAVCETENSLTINDFITEISRPIAEKPNESNSFQVHVIGDCHLIIKTPSTKSWRKGPGFGVRVTRVEEELPFELSQLFDGVYALRLAREDAYGPVDVIITSKSKPVVEHVTELDFGTPWLKIDNWKRAAQALSSKLLNDLNSAQNGLSEAYHRVTLDLQTMGKILRGEAECRTGSLGHLAKTAHATIAKSKQLYASIQQGTGEYIDASSVLLRDRAEGVRKDASKLANNAWTMMYQQLEKAHQSTQRLDLSRISHQAKELARSQSLATAQQQARGLARWRRWRDLTPDENGRGCRTTFR